MRVPATVRKCNWIGSGKETRSGAIIAIAQSRGSSVQPRTIQSLLRGSPGTLDVRGLQPLKGSYGSDGVWLSHFRRTSVQPVSPYQRRVESLRSDLHDPVPAPLGRTALAAWLDQVVASARCGAHP